MKLTNSIAVWCNTEEKADKFIEYIESQGYTWYSFSIFGMSCFDRFKENTCYCLSTNGNSIQYQSHEYFASRGFEIINFDRFMEEVEN